MTFVPAPRLAAALAAVLLLALAGCRREDPRVRHLGAGISKDSAVAVMGGTPDRPYAYLVSGQYIEALLYRRDGAEGEVDQLTRNQLTPVVLVDGQVRGWGWRFWDSVAAAHGIEVTPRED